MRRQQSPRKPERGARFWAAAATVAFHALLLLCLLFSFLRYPPDDVEKWPPEPVKEIVFEDVEELYASGEFVRTGDQFDDPVADSDNAPSNQDSDEPTQPGPDKANAGHKADPKAPVASKKESPMKVKDQPKGPTKEELEQEKKRQEAKRQQQAKKTADDATRNAFGGKGKGKQGQADGNSDIGASSGTPGSGVEGRTLEHWDRVASTKVGVIAIRVKVNSEGRVVSASYSPNGSNGAVAGDTRMRQRCVAKSKECRFSVKKGAPEASGYIYWRFK